MYASRLFHVDGPQNVHASVLTMYDNIVYRNTSQLLYDNHCTGD